MRPIGEAVRAALRALGIARGVARAAAVSAWSAAASDAVGDEAAGRTRALRVDGDAIVVAVSSPVVAQELRLRSGELVEALARRAPESGVRRIRFVAGEP